MTASLGGLRALETEMRRRLPIPALLSYVEASKLVGMTAGTIRAYCSNGKLRKGLDFVVIEYWAGRYKRRVRRITRFGLVRLLNRSFSPPSSIQEQSKP